MWQDEASHLTLDQTNLMGRRRRKRGEKEREKKRRETGEKSSNFSLRSTEIGGLVFLEPGTKDHLLDKATHECQKHKISSRIQVKSSGNQGFRVQEVSTGLPRSTSTLQEVGLLLLWLFSTLRVAWLCLAPRRMFGCILNHGKLP